MTVGLPEPFPRLKSVQTDDRNPAIRLFGKRFFADQGALELLAELLGVAFSHKRIGSGSLICGRLPAQEELSHWPDESHLHYRPAVKLNLKLFALLEASRIDSRPAVHVQHYIDLTRRLEARIQTNEGSAQEVVEWLSDLLRGFQGAGATRTWCAQVFFPITPAFLARETIWNASVANGDGVDDWDTITQGFAHYFSVNRHDFLARGGELLYLQLCNALATDAAVLNGFVAGLRAVEPEAIAPEEEDPRQLHALLERGLQGLSGPSAALDTLVEVIEELDPETGAAVDRVQDDEGWLSCEWCPRESWQEGYLFAVELSRVLQAALDPVERLEMLTVGCVLQVLRSLCAQSARYAGVERTAAPLGYAWLVAPPEGASRPLRLASQRNLQAVLGLIQRALRADALVENAQHDRTPAEKLYREADNKYGHKLLLALGKKLGLIVPYRGPGARFTMTDSILRYLVLALLRPGERCTYDEFLQRLYLHYGMAIEGEHLTEAAAWSGFPANSSIQPGNGGWLAASLRAGGFLAELSDAHSIVRNTYALAEDAPAGGRA